MADHAQGSQMPAQEFPAPQICFDERHQAYKALMQDVAERLGESEVNSIVFQQDLPEKARQQSGLDLLINLERNGLFSPGNIEPLADLLKKIHRHDLVTHFVDGYWQRYGGTQGLSPERHSSLPAQKSPRLASAKNRSYSVPAGPQILVHPQCVQETTATFNTRPTHPITEDINSQPAGLELTPRPLPNLHSGPPVPSATISPSGHPVHYSMRHQSHSYPQMEPGGAYMQDIQTPPNSAAVQSEVYSMPHVNGGRTRHLSEQVQKHLHYSGFPRTSTPQLPNEDRMRKIGVQQPIILYQQGYGRAMSSGGGTPGSASGTSSLVDSPSLSHSLHSSSEIVFGNESQLRHSFDLGQQMTAHGGHQWQQRKVHSLDQSYRHQQQPFHRLSETFPRANDSTAFAREYQTQSHSNVDNPMNAFLPHEPPVQPLPHQSLPPSNIEYSHVRRLMTMNQPPDRSMTPPPHVLNMMAQGVSGQPYASSSEVGAFSAQQHPVQRVHHSAHSLNHFDSGLVMLPPAQPQWSTTSSTVESIHPWMSASNEGLSHHTTRARHSASIAVQTDQSPDETSPSSPASRDDEENAKSMSPLFSRKKTPERRDSFSPKSRPRHWKLQLTRKHSRVAKLQWQIKRNLLNKAIYKHKESKCLTCSEKLEVDAGPEGKFRLNLIFRLYPYGLENDRNISATLAVETEVPKKCPRPPDTTRVKLSVVAFDVKESTKLSDKPDVTILANIRDYLVHGFLTHDSLKNSHSDLIEIQASAELLY